MIETACALVLFAATVLVWFVAPGSRPAARVQLRFAAILFAALATAVPVAPAAAAPIALLVLPIGLAVLALATAASLVRSLPAALAAALLAADSLAALAAALTGWSALALAPAALAIAAIAALCLRRFDDARLTSLQGLASALCFVAVASAFSLEGPHAAVLLFSAAGLLGLTLALSRSDAAVEARARPQASGFGVGGRRRV